jgi:hypothetical protein
MVTKIDNQSSCLCVLSITKNYSLHQLFRFIE